jgi:Dyp-type peroxidase family
MRSIIAKWSIKPGCEQQAIAALHELAESVRREEPYTLMYLIHTANAEGSRPTPAPNEVIFVSAWPDQAAFEQHLNGPVFQEWKGKHLDLFLTNSNGDLFVTSEFMDRRAGFIRTAGGGWSVGSLNLQQTALDQFDLHNVEDTVRAALADTQGNILKSNGRDHHIHLFVKFTGEPAAVTAWLQMMGAQYVTSAWQQKQQAEARRRDKDADREVFVNLCLSAAGYTRLEPTVVVPDDPSFRAGAKAAADRLNDPPVAEWQNCFQQQLHALVIVAADHAADAESTADAITATLCTAGEVFHREIGAAMRLDRNGQVTTDTTGPVYEHFGYVDNISQPLFFKDDVDNARRTSGGFDRYDPSAPLDLVLLKDPNGGPNGYGSYFVYRKLAQNVAQFNADVDELAQELAKTEPDRDATAIKKLALAYIMGRFPDGTPVVEQSVDGWVSQPNNFNFDSDVDGVRCPFHAHIRKVNPRGDKVRQFTLAPSEDRARRIVRRGVSFGPRTLDPGAEEVGLLFICAQSNIADQFEFIQTIWSNLTDFLRPGTGLDPIIGQAKSTAADVPQQWPRDYGSHNEVDFTPDGPKVHSTYVPHSFGKWVTMRGGEYFFVPSLSFLSGTTT